MPTTKLHKPRERRGVDPTAGTIEPLSQSPLPVIGCDRSQVPEGPKLRKRTIIRREQVKHQVLDRAGEQVADAT
jgi:hypothetical protein